MSITDRELTFYLREDRRINECNICEVVISAMEKNKSGDWCREFWGLGDTAISFASHLKEVMGQAMWVEEGREGTQGKSLSSFLAATVVTVVISYNDPHWLP